ncbi:hypothetical protein DRP77_10130, partial [Candidatus Poribacteria bacterium]
MILYDDPATENLRIEEIADYLSSKLPRLEVEVRPGFFQHHLGGLAPSERERAIDLLAREIASCRVRNPFRPIWGVDFEPLYGEVEFERRGVENPSRKPFGIIYD